MRLGIAPLDVMLENTLRFLLSGTPSLQLLCHPLHHVAEEAGAVAEQVLHNQLTHITIQGLQSEGGEQV